jgi:hypothetical protein
LVENTLLVRAWFKGKGNGSPNHDPKAPPASNLNPRDNNDLQASPVASKPRNDNGVGFEALFRESRTLTQGLAHEKKERSIIAEIIAESILEQQDLQGHCLVAPEVKEDDSPVTEHVDQILADCCETLGASFALSLTGTEDLEDCDESFLKTESDADIDSRVARRQTCMMGSLNENGCADDSWEETPRKRFEMW